jgi:uncharacterized protein
MTSPCNSVCQIDSTTKLCKGCKRTLEEIANWTRMSEQQRQKIMAELSER